MSDEDFKDDRDFDDCSIAQPKQDWLFWLIVLITLLVVGKAAHVMLRLL